jgi:enoyl-CoA hydratase/carnithine racemase
MAEQVLLRERRGHVVCATMNRPRVMNALSAELRQELAKFWRDFRDDGELRVAIIAGAGDRAFSTGRDLKETAAADAGGTALEFEGTGDYGYPSNIKIGKPVIAAVNGHCLAAGLMIALGSDIRICSDTARFGNPQVTRGRGTRIPFHLSQVGVPRAVALDMTLTGRPLDAEAALRWGLVSRVVPQASLLDEAWAIAEGIAGNSPVVVTGIKRAVELGLLDLPANEAMALWAPITGMMGNTADAVEGAKSFAEGRKGAFG